MGRGEKKKRVLDLVELILLCLLSRTDQFASLPNPLVEVASPKYHRGFFFFVWVFCVGGAIHVPKRDANHTLAGFFPLGGIHRWRTGTIMLSVASGIHYFAASIVATRLGLSCPRLGFFYCFLFCLGILLLNHGERSCPCSCLSLRPSFFAFHFCLTVIHIALLSNFFYLSFLHKVSHDGSSTAVIL